ncbi:unnamed protein product [Rangifer tarandus platyrhynchus]|uniref:Uncharacterized protein n=2 Tax=Rangifer tarandus platyrhynchus TaxID=3082113 RepID=A0ABN8ZZW2_RANTA|nr:unnamed protein product [Rangifer tarandus platyrhynchus]CAI9711269.1 unnamed protein product [Rangifer tarandus platyrhynchus]
MLLLPASLGPLGLVYVEEAPKTPLNHYRTVTFRQLTQAKQGNECSLQWGGQVPESLIFKPFTNFLNSPMNNGTADVSKYTSSVPFYNDDGLGLDGQRWFTEDVTVRPGNPPAWLCPDLGDSCLSSSRTEAC